MSLHTKWCTKAYRRNEVDRRYICSVALPHSNPLLSDHILRELCASSKQCHSSTTKNSHEYVSPKTMETELVPKHFTKCSFHDWESVEKTTVIESLEWNGQYGDWTPSHTGVRQIDLKGRWVSCISEAQGNCTITYCRDGEKQNTFLLEKTKHMERYKVVKQTEKQRDMNKDAGKDEIHSWNLSNLLSKSCEERHQSKVEVVLETTINYECILSVEVWGLVGGVVSARGAASPVQSMYVHYTFRNTHTHSCILSIHTSCTHAHTHVHMMPLVRYWKPS